jgi:hypothetical protein
VSQRGASRRSRFETVAAPARFRYPPADLRVPGDRRSSQRAAGTRARYHAQYGHAVSRRGWTAGWASVKQHPAALGRTAFNIAVLSLLGWALVWFFASDRFYVSQIIVQGNKRLSADLIRQASGLQGYSTFWIDPERAASQIGSALPPITSIKVRHGMSNTVTLLVQEQEEQIVWRRGGAHYWVDENGDLRPVQSEEQPFAADWVPTADWTLLVNDVRPAVGALNPGEGGAAALSVEPDVLIALRQIVHLLPEVRVVEYAPAVGLRYLHSRGWMVYLGTGSDMAQKAHVLRAIEVQFAGKAGASSDVVQPTLIDLRYPDSPYYRLPAPEGD